MGARGLARTRPFDVLTFDCYGTLIDWESGITKAFAAEAARRGVPPEPARVVQAYRDIEAEVEAGPYRPYREVLREAGLGVARRLGWTMAPERAGWLAASLPLWTPFADTNPALARLRRRFHLAILSNVDDDLLAETMRHFSVTFDWVVTAQQVRSYKPRPAHFQEGIRKAGGAERILHVARSVFHDVEPAADLGLAVAWVNRAAETVPNGGPSPEFIVSNLLELADVLGA
ncbi:MAG: haloacid dehalogenase type II [Gemmatimonadetes bacterium]|nr:haloacid dehalogenase type II [Gemmatimonadota bacterium]